MLKFFSDKIMKFTVGDNIDEDHCVALTHEFFRCKDSFQEFKRYAALLENNKNSREYSYKAYNAYASFIHHLYEFLLGSYIRDQGNTNKKYKDNDERIKINEDMIIREAQRIMNKYHDSIKRGDAPEWVNDIQYYDITISSDFAKDFREYRNKVVGHVSYERVLKLSLSEFYCKYHKFLYYLYIDFAEWWAKKPDQEFPDLKEITNFSILIQRKDLK